MFLLLIASLFFGSVTSQTSNVTRIVGGYPISIESAPWQVAVIYDGYLECGGSILSRRLVLTAAHCVDYGKLRKFRVRAGSKYFRRGGQLRRISKIVINSNFNAKTQNHDIAIAKLKSPLTLGRGVRPVKLAASYQPRSGHATVTGWGMRRAQSYRASRRLRAVGVRFVSLSRCRRDYRNSGPITKNMVCAGAPQTGGRDACQGDSGGPLVAGDVQYGVVAFGIGCGRAKYPGVYTSVSRHRRWIERTAKRI